MRPPFICLGSRERATCTLRYSCQSCPLFTFPPCHAAWHCFPPSNPLPFLLVRLSPFSSPQPLLLTVATALYHICYMAEAARKLGLDGSAAAFVPLCRELANDSEPEIRQTLAEQIPQLLRAYAPVRPACAHMPRYALPARICPGTRCLRAYASVRPACAHMPRYALPARICLGTPCLRAYAPVRPACAHMPRYALPARICPGTPCLRAYAPVCPACAHMPRYALPVRICPGMPCLRAYAPVRAALPCCTAPVLLALPCPAPVRPARVHMSRYALPLLLCAPALPFTRAPHLHFFRCTRACAYACT
ncbi:unnamed protein product [Closterium sp. Naga37s-1]|nr:unnamed protein product [Closterium sp. Naga37s-1]